jgi:homoserine kinase
MSGGGSISNSRILVATALGSACAGAALAVAVVKTLQRRNDAKTSLQPHRPSVIMGYQSDSRNDMSGGGGGGSGGGGGNPGEKLMPHQHEEKMRRRVEARALVEEDNFQPRNSVTVRVPATSANMGPGCTYYSYILPSHIRIATMIVNAPYRITHSTKRLGNKTNENNTDDTIGMAVDLWSEVTVTRADKFAITAEGDGADEMPKDSSNLLVLGCKEAFAAAGKEMPTLSYRVVSRIPFARGLGSSSAAIVAGIIAGLVLAGHRLPCWGSEALLQIAAGIEVR